MASLQQNRCCQPSPFSTCVSQMAVVSISFRLSRRPPGIAHCDANRGNIATAVAAVKAGALDYLAKPADADSVEAALLSNGDGLPPENPMSADGFAGNIFNGFTSMRP